MQFSEELNKLAAKLSELLVLEYQYLGFNSLYYDEKRRVCGNGSCTATNNTFDALRAGVAWTNSDTSLDGAQYMSLFSTGTTPAGQTNTAAIIANSDCANSLANCAAYHASIHGGTTGIWYLPSQAELMLIWDLDAYNYANRATTGYNYLTTSGSGCYWSSTASS